MGQNLSSAVMAQRKEPHDSLDYFPTPPWATRALCEWLQNPADRLFGGPEHAPTTGNLTVWEPACGEGHMAWPLLEYFRTVLATDVHDYGASFPEQAAVVDFLWDTPEAVKEIAVDWVITNPPFRLAARFITKARREATEGVAMLVRTAFLEGQVRHRKLFSESPPSVILQFSERVPMVKGRLDRKKSTATAYCWLVWFTGSALSNTPTRFEWIAPCRKRLDRDADWPVPAPATKSPESELML